MRLSTPIDHTTADFVNNRGSCHCALSRVVAVHCRMSMVRMHSAESSWVCAGPIRNVCVRCARPVFTHDRLEWTRQSLPAHDCRVPDRFAAVTDFHSGHCRRTRAHRMCGASHAPMGRPHVELDAWSRESPVIRTGP